MNRFNLICYFNFFYSSCFTSNLENLFHSHSLLIYFSIYIVTSKRIFSILLFKRLLNSIGLCWFSVLCNSKLARYIYYRCSFDFFFFNSATSSPFQVCSSSAMSFYNTCLSFTHSNFSAVFSLVQCLCNSKFLPAL